MFERLRWPILKLLGLHKVFASFEDEILFLHGVLERHGIDAESEFLLEALRRHGEAYVEVTEYYPDGLKTLDPKDWL